MIWRTIMIIFFSHLFFGVQSQTLGPYLISTSGEEYTTDEFSVYASIGEPINTMETDGQITISQGVLQSIFTTGTEGLQNCASNTGRMFFEDCDDGTLFFFIEDQNGKVLDPYFGEGITFEDRDGITVNFGYKKATFPTPCSKAEEAVLLTCIEEVTTTSVVNILDESLVIIYPNPSFGQFTMDLSHIEDRVKEVSVYDILGKQIELTRQDFPVGTTNIEINLDFISPGTYLLQVETESGLINKKFVINKDQ